MNDEPRAQSADPPAGDAIPFEVEPVNLRAEGVPLGERRRTLLSSIALYAPVAYAGSSVLRDGSHALGLRVALAIGALLAVRALSLAIDELPSAPRSARATVVFGLVAAVLACGGARTLSAAVATTLAASLAVACALPGIEALAGLGGLAQARPASRRGSTLVTGAGWLLVAGLDCARLVARRAAGGGSRASDGWLAALEVALLTWTMVHLARARWRRRLELGARERFDLLFGAAALGLPLALVVAASLEPFAPDLDMSIVLVAPALALIGGALAARLVRDPVAGGSVVARGWLALVFGLVAWTAVEMWASTTAAYVAFFATGAGTAIGLGAAAAVRTLGLFDPLAPPVLRAIARAREATSSTDPREVERGTLAALRALSGTPMPKVGASGVSAPRLLTFAPLREITLDAAGEPRERDPSPRDEPSIDPDAPSAVERVVPRVLLELLLTEPLGVVRTEVLRALEVRRPDLRPALAWCDRHDALAVVALMVDGDLEGLLTLPLGRETPGDESIGLTHARTLRAIARTLAARIALQTALARATLRTQRAEAHAREVDTLLELAAEREARLGRSLAGGARPWAERIAIGGYAPAARALRGQLDALARTPTQLAWVHRPGTDPTPYAARLHLESGRRGALHVVDAARRGSIEPSTWSDPVASPLELARDGTLLVRNAHRLPPELQLAIVHALGFRRGPSHDAVPLDVRVLLAFTADEPESDESWRARLIPALAGRLHEPPLRIAPLVRRIEDVRAIALDRLAVLGAARGGEPLGISEEALGVLVEHDWPGDDDELDAVLLAAACTSSGPRLEAAALRARLPAAPRAPLRASTTPRVTRDATDHGTKEAAKKG